MGWEVHISSTFTRGQKPSFCRLRWGFHNKRPPRGTPGVGHCWEYATCGPLPDGAEVRCWFRVRGCWCLRTAVGAARDQRSPGGVVAPPAGWVLSHRLTPGPHCRPCWVGGEGSREASSAHGQPAAHPGVLDKLLPLGLSTPGFLHLDQASVLPTPSLEGDPCHQQNHVEKLIYENQVKADCGFSSSIHSSIIHIYLQNLQNQDFGARHCPKSWGYGSEQGR